MDGVEDTKGVSVAKSEDFGAWYTQVRAGNGLRVETEEVITRSEMIEYHDVSGSVEEHRSLSSLGATS